MRRLFNILLCALAMLIVALLSAFLAMRLAIHGREVEVPNLMGLTDADARKVASSCGLKMNLEKHFYSTLTPARRILSQYPAPGTRVRREWEMRVIESDGPQEVSVPNVVGQTEREALVTIRRLSFDPGTVAHIPAPGPAGIVLSETPSAAAGADGSRISLLVSEPSSVVRMRQAAPEDPRDSDAPQLVVGATEPAATESSVNPTNDNAKPDADGAQNANLQPATASPDNAYVMPSLIGLTLPVANTRLAVMGLKITIIKSVLRPVQTVAPISSASVNDSSDIMPITPVASIVLPNTIGLQSPAAGHRVTKTDTIRVVLNH